MKRGGVTESGCGYRNEYSGQQDTTMLMMIVTMETHTPINSVYSLAKLCSSITKIPAMNAPREGGEGRRDNYRW